MHKCPAACMKKCRVRCRTVLLFLVPVVLYICFSISMSIRVLQEHTFDYRELGGATGGGGGGLSHVEEGKEEEVKDMPPRQPVPDTVALNRIYSRLRRQSLQHCPNLTRPSHSDVIIDHQFFQLQNDKLGHEIRIYSAHFDDRDYVGDLPVLRLLVVSPKVEEAGVQCLVWYEGVDQPIVTVANIKKNGGGHGVEKVKYEQYLFTCSLSTSYPTPTHVSVVAEVCGRPTTLVPVIYPSLQEEHVVGVCGPLMWGESVNTNVFRVVEWIEMLRELNATEVTVYASTVKGMELTKETLNALKLYAKSGFVDLRFMPGPRDVPTWGNVNAGDPAALNDCMYRNMYRYRYAVVMDTDEIIMPRKDITYPAMLEEIDRRQNVKYPWPSYTFRNTYFWMGCKGDTEEEPGTHALVKHLYAMRIKKRERNNKYMFGPKSIIDPRKCISVFNHYCWIRFPKMEKPFTIDVKTAIAMNNHYRIVHSGKKKEKCAELEEKGLTDQIGYRYRKRVIPRILKVLKKVNATYKITRAH